MKGNCAECCRRWVCEIDPSDCNEWTDHVPVTNADRIRAMSDDELADVLREFAKKPMQGSFLKWLKQPAE